MTRQEIITRFLALSWLYFRLTDRTAAEIEHDELVEMLELINAGNEPMMWSEQHIA